MKTDKDFKLDAYDSLLVRECKREQPSMRRLRRIVGMRADLPVSFIRDSDVAARLLELVEATGLMDLRGFAEEIGHRWRHMEVGGAPLDMTGDAVRVAASRLQGAPVNVLPGYRPTIKAYTVVAREASGRGTVWIRLVAGRGVYDVMRRGAEMCRRDWGFESVDDVKVVGVAAGDVKMLNWED
jgi:hypothetical protein